MNQLRLISLILITTASFQINAQSMSGFLDLSHKGGERGSGQYFVGVGLNPKATAAFEIKQSLEVPQSDDQSETAVCRTEIRLNAGNFTVILTDAQRNNKATLKQDMTFYTEYWDDSAECSSVSEVMSHNLTFSAYFPAGSINLTYAPPRGFTKLILAATIMPYGNNIVLRPAMSSTGQAVVENLKEQLSAQLKRNNREGLFYYLSAENRNTMIELGREYIELK